MILLIVFLCFLLAYALKYTYSLALIILKRKYPVREFTTSTAELHKIIRIENDEWDLEKIKEQELITISGSSENDGWYFIQLITNHNTHSANFHLYENGIFYSGTFNGKRNSDRTIVCGPLLVDMRSPFRKWRINFRGYLSDSSGSSHFICVSGWWKSVSNARFFYSNAPISTYNDIINSNKLDFIGNLKTIESFRLSLLMNQMGEFYAEVRIGEHVVENRYRGLRERTPFNGISSSTQFSTYLSDGNSISHRSSCYNNSLNLEHGILFKADHSVSAIKMHFSDQFDESSLKPLSFDVARDNNPFTLRKESAICEFSFTREDQMVVNVVTFKVNRGLEKGIGFVIRTRESISPIENISLEYFPEYIASNLERRREVLPFFHRACQDKSLTGGKGANLARLQSIANGYDVPLGIVVTTAAFENYIKSNTEILKEIRKLDETAKSNEYYESIGAQIEQQMIRGEISEELKLLILESLPTSEFYAVRSSAVGEDGADLSSAGQLESYLDTKPEEILGKLKLCWASNFRREVLNYRRNYGQHLNPPMAVVIQVMSRNGTAGVMFTANPVNADRGDIVINALKGSGEQIVSGVETPDEIHVNRLSNAITTSSTSCCLSEEQIYSLEKIGIYLEKLFNKPQDVEFVILNNRVNIVQSRDITGLDKETPFEVYTEINSALFTDKEILTNANVGEVLPAPIKIIEENVTVPIFDKVISCITVRDINDKIPAHFSVGFSVFHGKVFFNLGEAILRIWEHAQKDRITDIVFAGEPIFTNAMFRQAAERFGRASKTFALRRFYNMLKMVFYTSYKKLKEIKMVSKESYNLLPSQNASIDEIFKIFEKQQFYLCDAILYHTELSMFSSFTYVLCGMLIRGTDHGELSENDISDFANVFSNNARGDVISADVPNSLKKIAISIRQDGLEEKVMESSGDAALEIINNGENSSRELQQFLRNHGHRGPKELYLDSVTWDENPNLLVHTIQTILSCPDTTQKKIRNEEDIIDNLKCQPKGVAFRETAKDNLISTFHSTRKTLRLLGLKLFENGCLPDPNLWIHFTIDELKELYLTRNPKLISRAIRRKQVSGKFDGLQFPLVSHGPMNPINTDLDDESILVDHFKLKGTIVCEGKVRARARVARSLEEAKETKPGEILITVYTDICWSPFFPIISGIVTEIGGLLSHGAVVAREYGLPSIIAATNATKCFKTGDFVELDAISGHIRRIEMAADEKI